jgi:hypothetical protein
MAAAIGIGGMEQVWVSSGDAVVAFWFVTVSLRASTTKKIHKKILHFHQAAARSQTQYGQRSLGQVVPFVYRTDAR